MKRTLLITLSMIIALISTGQVTIEKENLPKLGQFYLRDTMFSTSGNWVASEFDKVSDSSPITFDFSWLNGSIFDTVLFYNPDTTEFSDSFPDADIAMRQDFDFMMELRDSGLYVQGMSLRGQIAKFDSALKYLPTPLSVGTQYFSKGSTILNIGFAQVFIDYERSLEAVKEGSIKMPNDSVYDILVLDIENDLNFIVVSGTDTLSTFSETEFVYEFYSPDFGYPLLRGLKSGSTVEEAQYIDLRTPIGVNSLIDGSTFNIYPNPSNGKVFINADTNVELLTIYDMSGKMVIEQQNLGEQFSVNNLENGVYYISITTEEGTSLQKLIIK